MTPNPPHHVCIVGSLIVAFGVSSLVRMITGWFGDEFTLDAGFITIPIGLGILRGRASSRGWALFFSALGILSVVFAMGWLSYHKFRGIPSSPLGFFPYAMTGLLVILASLFYILAILRSQRSWFSSDPEEMPSAKTWAWAAAAVGGTFSLAANANNLLLTNTIQHLVPVSTRIVLKDAVTGEGIQTISWSPPATHSLRKLKIPKLHIGVLGKPGGVEMTIQGIIDPPTQLHLEADGYENQHITLDRHTPPEIRVSMVPLGKPPPGQEK